MKANRWWVYQRERFPLGRHAVLTGAVCFGVMSASMPEGAGWGLTVAARAAVAFAVVLLLFLQLRIADEFKDAADDLRCRPQRPVPRGLVTLAELRRIGVAAAVLQAGLVAAAGPRLLLPLAYPIPACSHKLQSAWLAPPTKKAQHPRAAGAMQGVWSW
jgi:4-hydroxybenzoate polyprenyltransferase